MVQAPQVRGSVAQHGHVVGVEEPAHGEERSGVGPVEHVGRLLALEPGVHRDEPPARAERAERGDDPLPRVRSPDRDAVTGPDAERHRAAGRLVRQHRELAEREARVAIDDGLGVAVPVRRPLRQRRDRSGRIVRVHDPAASARRRG